ncbi:MAG: hypothetical protein ACR2ND_09495 [Solirubrobacteraceae bacterium]
MIRTRTLTVVAATAVLAGCGGSSNSTSNTASPANTASSATGASASRAGFIAKADALCQSTHLLQSQLGREAKGLSVAKLPPILHKQASIATNLAAKLHALQAPAGDQVPVGRFIGAVRLLGTLSTAAANSIQAGHTIAVEGLKFKLGSARQQETALGQGYGFRVCASGKSF